MRLFLLTILLNFIVLAVEDILFNSVLVVSVRLPKILYSYGNSSILNRMTNRLKRKEKERKMRRKKERKKERRKNRLNLLSTQGFK